MNRPFLLALSIAAFGGTAVAQTGSHAGHGNTQAGHAQAADVTTVPTDGAMLNAAPTTFSVIFPHAMKLTSLTLAAEGRTETTVPVSADVEANITVSVPLPTLTAGAYTANWVATSEGRHSMQGAVRFMVH